MKSFLHSGRLFSNGVAKKGIENCRREKLRAEGSIPLPPHPCDLPFLLHGLKKSRQADSKNRRQGVLRRTVGDFHQTTCYVKLFTGSVGSLFVQAQQWLGPVTPKVSRLPSIPISASQ